MMLFNSYIFIFAFWPLLTALYFLCAKAKKIRADECVLIAASILFYTMLDLRVATVLFASVGVNYVFLCLPRLLKRTESAAELSPGQRAKRLYVILPVILNAGLLLYFKYTNFIIENLNLISGSRIAFRQIALPLGISFFTFQQIAYIVSFYRGELPGKKNENELHAPARPLPNVIDYLIYILYFPKLVMGPLTEPADFLAQIHDPQKKKINAENIACGLKIFSYGLFKKMILADTFAKAAGWGIANPMWPSSLDWMLIIVFNSFMIYFDFSGYTDMATGVSLTLNITLPMNFDSPYKALSVRDFWKRWHMSLTAFLTKYLYLPLGGNRKGTVRTCINVMLVFFVSGVWHGANMTFVVWGIIHGALSVAERVIHEMKEKKTRGESADVNGISRNHHDENDKIKYSGSVYDGIGKVIRWAATFIIVSLLWLLFSATDINEWFYILGRLFAFEHLTLNVDLLGMFSIPESSLFIMPLFGEFFVRNAEKIWVFVFTLGAAVICFIPENNYRNLRVLRRRDLVLTVICFVAGVLALGQESIFVYFNF